MPMLSVPSRRPATFLIRRSPSGCMTTSIPPVARSIRRPPTSPSAAATPSPTRCSAVAASRNRRRRPEMGALMRMLFGLALLAGALALGGRAAEAHPHVWVTATSELVYAPDGSLTGVRYAWTFDDMFSSYALQGLTTK